MAKIRSTWGEYSTAGAPVGKCKITLDKHFTVPGELTAEEITRLSSSQQAEYEKKLEADMDKYRLIPKQLSLLSLTKLEVDVQARTGATLEIDLKDYAAQP